MNRNLLRCFSGLALTLAMGAPQAAFVNFIEAFNEVDPVVVETDLFAHPGVAMISGVTAEAAIVAGFHTPAISFGPVPAGKYAAVLFEPGDPAGVQPTLVSDVVLLTVLAPVPATADSGPFQDLLVGFLSADILLSDLQRTLQEEGYEYLGGIVENGTLQAVMQFSIDDVPTLTIRVLSDAGTREDIPEPGTLALLGFALLGMRRQRAS